MSKGKRIFELDFIRAFCALGIVLYHFVDYSSNSFYQGLGYFHSGVNLGAVCVTVFFVLSGVVLFHNYQKIDSPALFFWKRWKAIFPSFYIVYILFFLNNLLTHREWFLDKPIYTLPLSLIGLDGYFITSLPTWYIVGEWFLGAIIILYCLYPLLNWIIQKCELVACVAIFTLFILTSQLQMLNQAAFRNIFSCIFSFSIGILIEKHKLYNNKFVLIGGIVGTIVLTILPSNFYFSPMNNFAGIFAFFALFAVGGAICHKVKLLSCLISRVSDVSYEIFLFQHLIIAKIVSIWNPSSTLLTFLLLVIIIICIYIAAYLTSILSRRLLRSKPIIWIDERIKIK